MVFLKCMQNYLENITIADLEQISDRYDFLELYHTTLLLEGEQLVIIFIAVSFYLLFPRH